MVYDSLIDTPDGPLISKPAFYSAVLSGLVAVAAAMLRALS